ncbi:ribonucleotide reductase stimulatory protein [Enterobacter asburiae]|uniref:Ribonucleotide reductase stimulatory protein n=1 Tax=Enterobacter asburiae TaxID=61645 RepID=A0A376FDW3_ENTAS|nr:ribonucleotide reductase stimulatory protein [Enterobacter asburiae]
MAEAARREPWPRQVIRFLNDPHNRGLIRGVIAAGNRNFGDAFGRRRGCHFSKMRRTVSLSF